jgi:hypothetical protein
VWVCVRIPNAGPLADAKIYTSQGHFDGKTEIPLHPVWSCSKFLVTIEFGVLVSSVPFWLPLFA